LLQSVVDQPPTPITYPTANAALTLVSVLIEQNKVDQAVQQLERGELAPLQLIKEQHPAISAARYAARFRDITNVTAIKT